MFPLLLGILAGNELLRQRKKKAEQDELSEGVRGLLGAAPGEMGPPDEQGGMGMTGGRGLLADPTSVRKQMEYAAGIAGLRGQSTEGNNLLNAAMGRAMQEQQLKEGTRQFGLNYDAGRTDAGERVRQYDQTYQAGRDDAKLGQQNWEKQFGRQGEQFGLSHALDQQRTAIDWARLGIQRDAANAKEDARPKLPVGYQYQPSADGTGDIAAPIRGTPDHTKAVGTLEAFGDAEGRVGQMLQMIEGKDGKTPRGAPQKVGGYGSELYGEKAAQMSMLRGQIVADVAKMREMGVLQEGEAKRLEKLLRDPTTVGNLTTFNSTMAAGYKELRDQFKAKRGAHLQAHPWLIPPLPDGATLKR